MQIQDLYDIFLSFPLVSTDTRRIAPGSIFFALKGANFNGNSFADQALELGAKYVVIDEEQYRRDNEQYILVDDVLQTLQALAAYHRQQLHIPVIGITGTNGKTTTKELLYAVLSQRYKTFATKGNLNNHIGVPLSLLSIDSSVEVAVIEMGANHIGEIAALCEIAQPSYGLITNVGKAHLEGFGSFEGVKKAKGELYDYLSRTGGVLFLQADNMHLREMAAQRSFTEIVQYGFSENLPVSGRVENAMPVITLIWREANHRDTHRVKTNLTGAYNLENVLAAVAVGLRFSISPDLINIGLSEYVPANNRSQIIQTNRNTVIADFYNANASSVAAALDNIKVIDAQRKILILGDMFEMGEDTAEEHHKVIQKALQIDADLLIFAGNAFYEQKIEEDKCRFFETTEQVRDYLKAHPLQGCTILLKGSRGMAFEKIMDVL